MLHVVDVLAKDELFLYELYATTRIDEFVMLALNEQQLHSLLHMQYEAQKRSYQIKFPQARHEIIYYEDVRIGRMMTAIQRESIHLIDISLLPDFRGKGYGTKLLKRLQSNAADQKLSVTLQVLEGNPAQRLYERCGFNVTANRLPYIAMKWESIVKSTKLIGVKENE